MCQEQWLPALPRMALQSRGMMHVVCPTKPGIVPSGPPYLQRCTSDGVPFCLSALTPPCKCFALARMLPIRTVSSLPSWFGRWLDQVALYVCRHRRPCMCRKSKAKGEAAAKAGGDEEADEACGSAGKKPRASRKAAGAKRKTKAEAEAEAEVEAEEDDMGTGAQGTGHPCLVVKTASAVVQQCLLRGIARSGHGQRVRSPDAGHQCRLCCGL